MERTAARGCSASFSIKPIIVAVGCFGEKVTTANQSWKARWNISRQSTNNSATKTCCSPSNVCHDTLPRSGAARRCRRFFLQRDSRHPARPRRHGDVAHKSRQKITPCGTGRHCRILWHQEREEVKGQEYLLNVQRSAFSGQPVMRRAGHSIARLLQLSERPAR